MPTNKNAAIRYQTLDKCFRDRRHKYYIEDLIDKFTIIMGLEV